jgi:hypothetical protein
MQIIFQIVKKIIFMFPATKRAVSEDQFILAEFKVANKQSAKLTKGSECT